MPPYQTMIQSRNHKYDLRVHRVRYAIAHGIKAAVRKCQCCRNTVRLWLRRFKAEGPEGLAERSRRPHHCPHKTSPEAEAKVLAQRKKTPGFGARRLKREFDLAPGAGAIARILRENKVTRPRKKKRQVKRDLRAVKAQYKPLTRFHMDVKYLNDIPNYLPYMFTMGLPKFQYTIRGLKTGVVLLAYGSELSQTYAEITVRRLLEHLEKHGIDLTEVIVQTDRGGEFGGNAFYPSDRGFTHTIEETFGATHRLAPPGCPNANADVESFHAHEETEFFDIESFRHPRDFWEKVTSYQNYWNLGRTNFYKYSQTPLQILTAADPQLDPKILLLPPLNLDSLPPIKGGQHLPDLTGSGLARDGPPPSHLPTFSLPPHRTAQQRASAMYCR